MNDNSRISNSYIGTRDAQCLGKMAWGKKSAAKKYLSRMRHGSSTGLRVYRCPHCGGFHLGNKPAN